MVLENQSSKILDFNTRKNTGFFFFEDLDLKFQPGGNKNKERMGGGAKNKEQEASPLPEISLIDFNIWFICIFSTAIGKDTN